MPVYRTYIEFEAESMAEANDRVETHQRLHPTMKVGKAKYARPLKEEPKVPPLY